MPRLSNALYYERYLFLRTAWLEFQSLYTILPVSQQWELHAYYQPSKQLAKAELLEHRKRITGEQPSLPAKAGKHFDQLYRCFRVAYAYAAGNELRFRNAIAQLTAQRPRSFKAGEHLTWVTALARPEPDYRRLALAFLELARAYIPKKP